MKDIIASVDIGATKVAAALWNRESLLGRKREDVVLQGDERSIPDQVIRMVRELMDDVDEGAGQLHGTGVSSAGPFSKIDEMIELVSPNICGALAPERDVIPNQWSSVPLERVLKEQFDNIIIRNDAVSGAIAERTFGSGQGTENLVYVTWSTGIGTGAYVDGGLIEGKNGNAPHGGHIFLSTEGPRCGCGSIGHLEALSSGTSISLQYGDDKETAEVFRRYHEGDPKAVEVIDRAAMFFGKGLASINAVLDTELITIGGSVFLNNEDLLLPMVRDEFYRSFPLLSKDVRIEPTGLGKYLGDVAAISLIIPEEWVDDWKDIRPWEIDPVL